MIHRLLQPLDPGGYCLISRHNHATGQVESHYSHRLPARYYHLPSEFQLSRPSRWKLRTVRESGNLLLRVFQRAIAIARIVKRERCEAILACSGDLVDLPAGYLASVYARVPFYAYIFDDYQYQWTQRLARAFARCMERIVLKRAAGVIVPNEFLRDEYRHRYGIEAMVIHNPCSVEEIGEDHDLPWPADEREIRIVYTGAVYHAHYDAFRSLISAIQRLGRLDLRLHVYTAQPLAELEREGIGGPVVRHAHVSPGRAFQVQTESDILFLPLAFDSPIPEVIRTSAPGKMGEYLATGRPILVHAPADSFVSWYFSEHDCGVVVDQSDPKLLAQGIQSIIDDSDLRQKLAESARRCARTDFSVMAARAGFQRLLFRAKPGG